MKVYRNTLQRNLVLDTVRRMGNHPTPDEVFLYISEQFPNISRSTVYRNLSTLSEQGLVYRVEIPNTADRVDINNKRHYHILCNKCGKVDDVEMPYFNNIEDMIINTNGFVIESHSIVFSGLCSDCSKIL